MVVIIIDLNHSCKNENTPCSPPTQCNAWYVVYITSTHSVDPMSPYSSASQLHRTIVRPGLHPMHTQAHTYNVIITYNTHTQVPLLFMSPMMRAISIKTAVPLFGSTAPNVHASR